MAQALVPCTVGPGMQGAGIQGDQQRQGLLDKLLSLASISRHSVRQVALWCLLLLPEQMGWMGNGSRVE